MSAQRIPSSPARCQNPAVNVLLLREALLVRSQLGRNEAPHLLAKGL